MSEVTRAIILAAGLGTRLKSLTHNKPKALMSIAGQPAIVHVIRQLVAQGIHDIAINTHHHAAQLRHDLGDGSRYNARFYFSHEKHLLNSGGGVRTALDLLPGSGLFAVHNADILASIPIQNLAQICPKAGCALALVSNPKHNSAGDFSLRRNQVLLHHENKHTFSGVSVWHEDALQPYQTQHSFSLIEPIKKNIKAQQCTGILHQGQWFDIGRHRDLVQANRLFTP